MFVMLGAIAVAFIPFQRAIKNQNHFNEQIQLPTNTQIDQRLIVGAFIFGIGWGIAGICPAPALTLIGLGHFETLYFIVAMLVGMFIYRILNKGN